MNFAPLYITWIFLHRIAEFFHHWYVHSFIIYGHAVISFLEKLDKLFAFRITLRHFGKPLFQDRTVVGYFMGFVFRGGRILLGGVVYLLVLLLAVFVYVVWALMPIYIIFNIFIQR